MMLVYAFQFSGPFLFAARASICLLRTYSPAVTPGSNLHEGAVSEGDLTSVPMCDAHSAVMGLVAAASRTFSLRSESGNMTASKLGRRK
mgnify:FL=1